MDKILLEWEAPEFEHRPKEPSWYWASIILAGALLGIAIWQKNFFFGIFIVIAELLVLVWGAIEPPLVKFRLSEKGLTINDKKLYPFSELKHFSADHEGVLDQTWPDIVIHFHSQFRTTLRIKAPRANLPEVHRTFKSRLPETPFEPSLVDIIEKLLGF